MHPTRTLSPPRRQAPADPLPVDLAEWRSAALRAFFPLSFSRRASPAERRRAIAVYHYLAGARIGDDLRRRIAEVRIALERGF